MLKSLNAEGYTIVMITHDLTVANAAKRVIRIEDGQLSEEEALQKDATDASRNAELNARQDYGSDQHPPHRSVCSYFGTYAGRQNRCLRPAFTDSITVVPKKVTMGARIHRQRCATAGSDTMAAGCNSCR